MNDIKYALRMLFKEPGFTAMALLALTLGIGAGSAIFSVVNGVLLRPLPFPDAGRLVWVWETTPQLSTAPANPVEFLDFRDQNTSFEHMAAFIQGKITVTSGDVPEDIPAGVVSSGFFDVLGVSPVVGRAFSADEQEPDQNHVAILSAGLGQRFFGSDPKVLGRTITVSGYSFTVVGVMPANFRFPGKSELWVPLVLDRTKTDRGPHYLNVIARLKPRVPTAAAQAEMSTLAYRRQEQFPEKSAGHGVKLVSLRDTLVGNIRPALLALLAAVGMVLLIACANVANLLLARSMSRQKEFALRTALGASRWKVIRQLLAESLLLALTGGALGLLVSVWGVKLLLRLSPGDIPRTDEIGLDLSVAAFTVVVSIVTAIVFGLAPALNASKPDLNESLKEGSRGLTASLIRNRIRSLLVISEVALALVLLAGAGLMIKSFARLQSVDPGFNADHVLTLQVTLLKTRYEADSHVQVFNQQLLERIQSLPGVLAAGATDELPMAGSFSSDSFQIEGRPAPSPAERPLAECRLASPGFFQAMQIPLVGGRDLAEHDAAAAPGVAVINQTLARQFWPDSPAKDPIGNRVTLQGQEGGPLTIVGVVGDVKDFGLDVSTAPTIYFSYVQDPLKLGSTRSLSFVVRTASDPLGMAEPIRSEALSLDKELPIHDVRAMDQYLYESAARRRFNMVLLGIFAGVALLLAGVGIYGVTSHSVSQRTHEIGIRMALGAGRGSVAGLVLKQAIVPVLIGVALGVSAALAVTRFISSLLFDVSATDPGTFAAISFFLMIVATAASYFPAKRATSVDPMVALRYE
jgi:putative ABC transport system permease protein